MDFLANSLTGLALARIGLSRISPRGTLLLLVSINIPDLDYLSLWKSPLAFVEQHGGYTHSLICLPIAALAAVGCVSAVYRERLPWQRSAFLASLGVGCHLLLDWVTTWGFRPFLPFSSTWYHLDFDAAFDPYLFAALGVAALWPYFSKLVAGEIGSVVKPGRGSGVLALAALLMLESARAVMHQQAESQMKARLFEGAPALRVAAIPDAANPLKWTGIVETENLLRTLPINLLETFDSEAGKTYYKPPETAGTKAAKQTEPFRYFGYFASFPLWTAEPVLFANGYGTRIQLTDLRFGSPVDDAPASVALIDSSGKFIKSWFTLKSAGPPPP